MRLPAILLISGNPFTRKTIRSSLSSKGYPLIEVNDAPAALSQLELVSPGLVLQDFGLDTEHFGLAASPSIYRFCSACSPSPCINLSA